MKTLSELATHLEKVARAVSLHASQVAADTALTMVSDLVFITPVDTSQALSNWRVVLNAPLYVFIDPHYPGEFGSTQRYSATEAIALAKAILKEKKPGQKIYVVNSAPYINELNKGSSKQAPAMFVERAVARAARTIAKSKLKING